MCKLIIKYKGYASDPSIPPLDTIIRKTKRECTAVGRAHYKGDSYEWMWEYS